MTIVWKNILLLLVPFMLCACGKQIKTPEYFLLNPEYIQSAYDNCVTSRSTSDTFSKQCVAVMSVIPVFKQYLSELMSNPKTYGLKIMQAQIHLVELQKQLAAIEYQLQNSGELEQQQIEKLQTRKEELQGEVDRQALLVKSRQAILRMVH